MRAVIQRVKSASVRIQGTVHSQIDGGLLVLLGIEVADDMSDAEWLAGKIISLRIFDDDGGMMNRSVKETDGAIMVVSQFTLLAATKKGNRPSYIRAARPETAILLYQFFNELLEKSLSKPVQTGVFGSMMEVELINDGPVTILMDSKNRE